MSADHYFTANPHVEAKPTEVVFEAAGRTFHLAAAAGVFSAGRLDPGTAVLLRKADLPSGGTGAFLDLGCGYGAIACVLATCAPQATVYAVDVNERALELTQTNARALKARIAALPPDDVPAKIRFREIWSNPPIRVGKGELHALLERWLPRLEPGGVAWLVVAKHLGSDSLADWLRGLGWDVHKHASQQGFRVLRVTAAASSANSRDDSASGQQDS